MRCFEEVPLGTGVLLMTSLPVFTQSTLTMIFFWPSSPDARSWFLHQVRASLKTIG